MEPVKRYALHLRASMRKPIISDIFIALDSGFEGRCEVFT
jgi:hypothetical protein